MIFPGKIYLAYFPATNRWFRAIVQEALNAAVKVLFVDFGNIEWIKLEWLVDICHFYSACKIILELGIAYLEA